MAFSPTDSSLFGALFSDAELADLFSDARFIRYLIDVEFALAAAQGRVGVIPAGAVRKIEEAAKSIQIDHDALRRETERAGFPVIELVRQLRTEAGKEAGRFVHYGATTQDIMDTALVLQLRAVIRILESRIRTVISNLVQLTNRHRATLMAGRTHSQQALPITFGLKTAGWMTPLLRHLRRLKELEPRLLVIQLGGGAGTLASLDESGLRVQQALAERLDLNVPPMPWHTQRDGFAELAGWLSMVSGSLAKMGQDVILMAQSEVAEVRESADRTRGSSSTMPQKGNPVASEVIVAAARSNATHLTAMHGALVQEHERATHGWQVEWLSLPQMIALTGAALDKAVFLTEHLEVDEAAMRRNVEASNGLMLAEAATFALTEHMEPARAKQLVSEAVHTARSTHRHLIDVLRETTSAPVDWDLLRDERNYLGSTDAFISRVLSETRAFLNAVE